MVYLREYGATSTTMAQPEMDGADVDQPRGTTPEPFFTFFAYSSEFENKEKNPGTFTRFERHRLRF